MLEVADLSVAAYIVERRAENDYHFVEINAAAAALWAGQPHARLGPMRLDEAFPEAITRIAQAFTTCLDGRTPLERDSTVLVPWGEVTVRTSLIPLLHRNGEAPRLLGIVTDISRERRIRDELEQSNARLAIAMQALGGAHWFFDAQRRTFELGESFARLLGPCYKPMMSLEEWLAFVHEDDRSGTSFADQLESIKDEDTKEFRLQIGSDERWVRCHRRTVRNEWCVIGVAGVVIDITADRRRELMLRAQAQTDTLTGLGNRRCLEAILNAEAQHASEELSLLLIDVDNFKAFNDHYGHPAGDVVLKDIATILQGLAEPLSGTAVRYGGEEFIVVLPGVTRASARCAAAALVESVSLLGHEHIGSDHRVVTVSVGVATRGPRGDVTDLVPAADAALYQAKREGRNCFRTSRLPTGLNVLTCAS